MLQVALDFLEKCGVWGLFAATAIEASSLPFPGALFVLIYGYIMDVTPYQLVIIGAANGLVHTIFGMIPYMIGTKLGDFSKKKFDAKKIEKAQRWFRKYGNWSIALSKPTGFGNYISYISGMSRIKPWRYVLFSLIGTIPWNIILLFIGFYGNLETVQRFLDLSEKFGMILFICALAIAGVIFVVRKERERQKSRMQVEEG